MYRSDHAPAINGPFRPLYQLLYGYFTFIIHFILEPSYSPDRDIEMSYEHIIELTDGICVHENHNCDPVLRECKERVSAMCIYFIRKRGLSAYASIFSLLYFSLLFLFFWLEF